MKRTQQAIAIAVDDRCDNGEVFRAVCEDASEHLNADLVSVWKFEEEGDAIRCLCAFDALAESFSSGQSLSKNDCPTYFATIVEENTICAPDARTHPVTRELTEPYFLPNGIISLLDFIVHHDFRPVGIICCENRGGLRDWSQEDRDYLRSLAMLASFRTRM